MNTIHDLRGTLAAHADIADDGSGARAASIAHRVRVVRRRRAAGVGVAAVAAVAAVTTATLGLPGGAGHEPEPTSHLLGVAVPKTMTANGYTYDYDDAGSATADSATDGASVTVRPTGDAPIVVSWATEGADQRVRVHTPSDDFTSTRPDFADHVVVYPGSGRTTVKVTGKERTALAVYRLDEIRPAGVTTDAITFRRDVADRHLLAAAIAPEGANRLTFHVKVPLDGKPLVFSELCSATGAMKPDHEAWLDISVNGKPSWGTGCHADSTFDPGATTSVGPMTQFKPGQDLTVTLRLLDRDKGRPLDDPHARIGYGAYALTTPRRHFAGGLSLPRIAEADGHTWRLISVGSGVARPGRPWTMATPASEQRLMIEFGVNGRSGATTAAPTIDGHDTDGLISVGPGIHSVWDVSGGVVDAGHHVFGMGVRGTGEAQTAVGFYEMVD